MANERSGAISYPYKSVDYQAIGMNRPGNNRMKGVNIFQDKVHSVCVWGGGREAGVRGAERRRALKIKLNFYRLVEGGFDASPHTI